MSDYNKSVKKVERLSSYTNYRKRQNSKLVNYINSKKTKAKTILSKPSTDQNKSDADSLQLIHHKLPLEMSGTNIHFARDPSDILDFNTTSFEKEYSIELEESSETYVSADITPRDLPDLAVNTNSTPSKHLPFLRASDSNILNTALGGNNEFKIQSSSIFNNQISSKSEKRNQSENRDKTEGSDFRMFFKEQERAAIAIQRAFRKRMVSNHKAVQTEQTLDLSFLNQKSLLLLVKWAELLESKGLILEL